MSEAVQIDFVANTKKFNSDVDNSGKTLTKFADKTKQTQSHLNNTGNSITNFADKTKQATVSAFQFAKGMIYANLIQAGFSKALSAIPAIGQTFDALGQVIMNNLFYPLSQEVLPVLKDMVKWVRDNRTNFVKLGQIIANVFRAAVSIVKAFFETGKKLFDQFVTGAFGSTQNAFGSFLDIMNFALLKLTFLITFIQILLEPLLSSIIDLFVSIYKNGIQPFFQGLAEGFSSAMGEGQGFTNLIIELFDALIDLVDAVSMGLKTLAPVFRFIGKVLGILIFGIIKGIILVIKALGNLGATFKAIGNQIKESLEIFSPSNLIAGISALGSAIRNGVGGAWDYVKGKFSIFWEWIKSKFDSLTKIFKNLGKDISGSIEGGLTDAKEAFNKSAIGNFVNKTLFKENNEPTPQIPTAGTNSNSNVDNSKTTQNNNIVINGATNPTETANKVQGVLKSNSLRDQLNNASTGKGIK